MRRSILAMTVAIVSLFALAGLAADDPKPAGPSKPGRPVITPDVRLKAATDATADQLLKDNGSGGGVDSQLRENGGNVFLSTIGAHLVLYPDTSGSYITGTNTSLTLYGMGGTISMVNADTMVYGYGTTAMTVTGSGSTGTTAALNVRNQAGASILYARDDGSVGIGTTTPSVKFQVASDAAANATISTGVDPVNGPAFNMGYGGATFGRGAGFLNVRPDASAVAPNPSLRFQTADIERMIITNTGAVGIGTSSPGSGLASFQESPLHVYSTADKNTFLTVQNPTNSVYAMAVVRAVADTANISLASHATSNTDSRYGLTLGGWNELISVGGNGLVIGAGTNQPLVLGTNLQNRMRIESNGDVSIGNNGSSINATVYGTLTATKVIGAVYQDVAEWVPATQKMAPGTVVVLNREHKNEVMPSAHAYDTAVAGVVSEQPGLVLGVASDSKAQIATTGRVKVHVDATAGPIAIGDLLVTSDKTGMAMKSQPVDIGGVPFHRPGTVIGKALEPLPDGQGDILVLLSLQ